MRKKVTLVLVSLILVLCSLSLLVACNHTHTYGDWAITVTPEANKQGVAERVCTDCGEKETVDIPSLSDESVWTKTTVDATEFAAGCDIYTSEYGTVEVEIAATGHIWREWVEDKYLASSATCTEAATYYKSCACGEKSSETFVSGEALGHDFSELNAKVDASCIADGHVEYKSCSRCEKNFDADGKEIADIVIAKDPSAHGFGDWVEEVSATCSAEGVKGHKDCTLCGKHFDVDGVEIVDLSITKLNHTFAEIANEDTLVSGANCQSPAVYYKSCSVCHVNSEETFTYGEIGNHILDDGICTICNKIKVAVDKNDGSDASISYVEANSILDESLLSVPSLENNRFLGWFVEGSAFSANTPITSSITIKAAWADYSGFANKNYRYAYTTNGGIALNYSTIDYNIATNAEGIATVVGGSTSAPVYPGSTLSFAWLDKAKGLAYIVESYSYTSDSSYDDDDYGWGSSSSSTTSGVRYYLALVDSESGIILRAQYSLEEMPDATATFKVGASAFMLVPTEADVEAVTSEDYKGSKLDSQAGWIFVISYKGTAIYTSDNDVYFGVSVCDLSGNALSADAVNSSDTVIISKGDEIIARFGKVEKKFATLDQYAGYYTQGDDTLVVSGLGTFVLGDKSGNYTIASDGYTLDAYVVVDGVNVEYAQITLDGSSFAILRPTAHITFVSNEEGTTAPDAGDYNINIVPNLPVMDNTTTKTFKGWALADGNIISSSYIVGEDITLTAVWADKVVVNIINSNGTVSVIYIGEGDVIGDCLEDCIGESDDYYFVGWYIDMNSNGIIDDGDIVVDDEAVIGADDTGLTVIAKWELIPVYVGDYTGSFLRNADYCYGSSKSLTISISGEISGAYTGNVVSYADGKLIWADSKSTQHTFLFDEGGKIIVYLISEDGFDYAVFGKNLAKDGKVSLQKGVNAPLQGNATTYKTCAQFISMTTAYGENTTVFYYGDILLVNAVLKNAQGEDLTVSNVCDSDSVVVYDGNGAQVFALVSPKGVASLGKTYTYGEIRPLIPDNYFGNYSLDGEANLVIKGNGAFVWGDKSGNYSELDANSVEAYVVVDDVNTEYYIFTLADDGFTYNKVSVQVSFSSTIDPNGGVPADIQANKNVITVLPVLTADNHVFRGWKVEGDDTVYTEYTFTEAVSLSACWDIKVSLTVVYGNGLDSAVLYYGAGDTTAPVEPELTNGKVFDYWYTSSDEGATVGAKYTPSVISENTVIYVAWTNPPIYMGSYYGARFFSYNTDTPNSITSKPLVFDRKGVSAPDGTIFSSYSSYRNPSVQVNVLDEATGKIALVYTYDYVSSSSSYLGSSSEETITPTTKNYYGYIDFVTGIMVINTSADSENFTSVWVLIPTDEKPTNSNFKSVTAWDSTKTKPILYVNGDEKVGVFYTNNTIYINVNFYNQNNEACDLSTSGLTQLIVKDSEGKLIAEYAYVDGNFEKMDGNQGSYNGDNGTLIIDGVKNAGFESESGTYTATENDNEFEVYFKDSEGNSVKYAIITLDKENKSYTMVVPMVSVSYVTDYDSVDNISTNKNIAITLPEGLTSDTHVFRGWYVQGDADKALIASPYIPTEDVTLVAKWDAKVTLTVVYGNGLDNAVLDYAVGDTVAPVAPEYKDGKAFDHWYLSADDGVTESGVYTAGVISESMTIYCAWKDASPLIGTYKGFEVWSSSGNGWLSSKSDLVIDADGKATSGPGISGNTARDYDESTGILYFGTYWAYYDNANGILIYNYSSGGDTLKNDIYVMFKGVDSVTNGGASVSNVMQFVWGNGLNRLIDITITKGDVTENFILYIADNKAQKVTIATDVASITTASALYVNKAITVNSLKIYDLNDNLIGDFAKSEDGNSMLAVE